MRDWDRYCTSTYTERIPELTKLDSTKSTMRYLPPKGTAGLPRSLVSGDKRSPFPPAMMMPNTFDLFIYTSKVPVSDRLDKPEPRRRSSSPHGVFRGGGGDTQDRTTDRRETGSFS